MSENDAINRQAAAFQDWNLRPLAQFIADLSNLYLLRDGSWPTELSNLKTAALTVFEARIEPMTDEASAHFRAIANGTRPQASHVNGLFTYLDVSTVHITQEDIDTLQNGAPELGLSETEEILNCLPLTISAYPRGLFVYISEDLELELEYLEHKHGISPHLGEVLRYAQRLGAYIVHFDRDGVIHKGLWIREDFVCLENKGGDDNA